MRDGNKRVDFLHRFDIAASRNGFANRQQKRAGPAQRVYEALLVDHEASLQNARLSCLKRRGLPRRGTRRLTGPGADTSRLPSSLGSTNRANPWQGEWFLLRAFSFERLRRRNQQFPSAVQIATNIRSLVMDNSVYEARWLLAPILGLCIAFISVGLLFG